MTEQTIEERIKIAKQMKDLLDSLDEIIKQELLQQKSQKEKSELSCDSLQDLI